MERCFASCCPDVAVMAAMVILHCHVIGGTPISLKSSCMFPSVHEMYCLQWLIPVLLIPKHWLHPAFIIDQAFFMWFYVVGFLWKEVGLLCWSDSDSCIFWPSCDTVFNGEMCAYVREKRQWLS
ncbi:Bladder cancer related protein [Dirofilaria immitis]|nr:Bladder cancer related protein [Dirofilaria immitis]